MAALAMMASAPDTNRKKPIWQSRVSNTVFWIIFQVAFSLAENVHFRTELKKDINQSHEKAIIIYIVNDFRGLFDYVCKYL